MGPEQAGPLPEGYIHTYIQGYNKARGQSTSSTTQVRKTELHEPFNIKLLKREGSPKESMQSVAKMRH